jgi:outer membrane protein assembly factor BamB
VTVDEELAGQGPAPDQAAAARAALERHVASMRRQRRWYAAAVALVAAAGVVVALVVWRSGEITHVHLRTAASPAPSVPLGTPVARPAVRWQTPDATAIGAPFAGGTVVTYSRHTVTGRDALTGEARWTFTRTDRDVCEVAQQQGRTIAIYRHGGNCDEVTTVDTGTGERIWERTLDENGLPINGRPLMIPGNNAIFVMTPSALYAIQVSSGACDTDSGTGCGSDSWTYAPPSGCAMTSAVPGSSGVLISEHCADGDHLVLRDPNAGTDSKDPKPIKWRLNKNGGIPVAADSFVGAIDPSTRELVLYDPAKGKVTTRVALSPAPTGTGPVRRLSAGQGELIWIDGTAYALDGNGAQLWSAPADNLPTVTASDTSQNPALDVSVILVPTSSGVAALDGATGAITDQYAVAAPPAGSRVFALGTGFLVAGTFTRVYR